MTWPAFIPQGNTSLIKATTTASAAQGSTDSSASGVQGFSVFAASTALCLVSIGPTTATAVLPTTGTPAKGMPIPGNTHLRFRAPPNYWLSVIMSTAGGVADVYVTPGTGF